MRPAPRLIDVTASLLRWHGGGIPIARRFVVLLCLFLGFIRKIGQKTTKKNGGGVPLSRAIERGNSVDSGGGWRRPSTSSSAAPLDAKPVLIGCCGRQERHRRRPSASAPRVPSPSHRRRRSRRHWPRFFDDAPGSGRFRLPPPPPHLLVFETIGVSQKDVWRLLTVGR